MEYGDIIEHKLNVDLFQYSDVGLAVLVLSQFMFILPMMLISQVTSEWSKDYDRLTKAYSTLRVNCDLFAKNSARAQQSAVLARLKVFGNRWRQAELAHPADLQHIDVIDAKGSFEDAYQTFLKAHFITDVGYKQFLS
jgi:hypothetical protein